MAHPPHPFHLCSKFISDLYTDLFVYIVEWGATHWVVHPSPSLPILFGLLWQPCLCYPSCFWVVQQRMLFTQQVVMQPHDMQTAPNRAAHCDCTSWYVQTHSTVTIPVLLSHRMTCRQDGRQDSQHPSIAAFWQLSTALDSIRWVFLNKLYFFCINMLGMATKELELALMLLNTV